MLGRVKKLSLFMIISSALALPSYGFANETREHLYHITEAFIQQQLPVKADEHLKIQVGGLDGQLKLADCGNNIEAALPMNQSSEDINSVELSCKGPVAWHIFVPVAIQMMGKVVITKHPILAEDVINEDDVELGEFDKLHLYNGYYDHTADVLGQVASHLITSGSVLTRRNLKQAILIQKGQTVAITAKTHQIAVTMQGIAKSDGGLHTNIKVFNPASNKLLDAIVTGAGKAEIIAG